jgi:hypothetical protein
MKSANVHAEGRAESHDNYSADFLASDQLDLYTMHKVAKVSSFRLLLPILGIGLVIALLFLIGN